MIAISGRHIRNAMVERRRMTRARPRRGARSPTAKFDTHDCWTASAMQLRSFGRPSTGYAGTAPALPLPACGERVGVRGRIHDSERSDSRQRPPPPLPPPPPPPPPRLRGPPPPPPPHPP